jgi:flagellar hook-length control protein FliK
MTVVDLLSLDLPDLSVADTPNPDDQPEADVTVASQLFSLLLSGSAMAARLPPTGFAVTQAAEGAMAMLASVGPEVAQPVTSAGPGSTILSGPQVSPPDAADGIPVQTRPQGLLPTAGDMPSLELLPPSLQAGLGLHKGADAPIPARIIVPGAGPGVPAMPQQAGTVPAVFAFRSEHRSTETGHAAPDADKDGPVAAPPAQATTPGSDVPAPGLAAGTTPLADLPELILSAAHQGDAEIPFGAPQPLVQAAPVPTPQGAGTPFVPAPLTAALSDLLMRRSDGPVELTLSPEELGRVRLSLSPDGDGLHVTVQVERGDTLDLLRRNSDLLLQEIRAQGFSGATFSFSGWAGDRPEQRAPSSPDASRPGMISNPDVSAPPPSLSPAAGLDLRL